MEENKIVSALEPGEELLWYGKPREFKTLDVVYRKRFLITSIISLAAAAALIVLYLSSAAKNNADLKYGLIVFIIAIGILVPMNIFLNAGKLRKDIAYAITDKRLLYIEENVSGAEYSMIKSAKIYTDRAGNTSLLCGSSGVKKVGSRVRGAALLGCHIDEEKNICDNLVFYALEDPEKIRKILKPYLKIEL